MNDDIFLILLSTDFKDIKSITHLAHKLPFKGEYISMEDFFPLLYKLLPREDLKNITDKLTVENFIFVSFNNAGFLNSLTNEIKMLLDDLKKKSTSGNAINRIYSLINSEISVVNPELQIVPTLTDASPILTFKFNTVREYLFFITAKYIHMKKEYYICSFCREPIFNVTPKQKSNLSNHRTILHPHCRDEYKKQKDRERKRKASEKQKLILNI
ncbi:hypothetical protein ACM1TL_13230 [Lysinibacillus capsici]|uniref:hypothetical protein n=1 Tax=Lysinibacillus TaxID=400634 RepID=UPI0022B944F9|nr:hypothetical protein [Lysinibacillus sp. JK80]UNT56488.1 hypothetical protein ICJ70_05325 [Lysinibacillus capsici]WBF57638.1 hypothetical protein HXV90_18330 [Lysinibacillus sp. JK80]